MQRKEPDGIVIACDYCGTDWDQELAMIEGHRGSIVCLECLKKALANLTESQEKFFCALCQREQPAGTRYWRPAPPSERANPDAALCTACVDQAAKAFDRDPDVDWKMPKKG